MSGGEEDRSEDPLRERLDRADRLIRRERLRREIGALGGRLGGADEEEEEVSEVELSFLEYVLAWETGPRSTHRDWLARRGETFIPPTELAGPRLKTELWRLIGALARARVFLYHTNHLGDAELYAALWSEVLSAESPDAARGRDDANHWDLADPSAGDEACWLCYYANEEERREWRELFPDVSLPRRKRPPFRRDHRLPVRD